MRLNLGCGKNKLDGYYNIDISNKANCDLVADLSKGIPLPDNCAEEVLCKHFIEHIADIIFIMNEIWRVCKNDAKVRIIVPHQDSPMAFADPTHKRIFNEESFKYYCSNGEHYCIHEIYGIKCNFLLVSQTVKKDKRHREIDIILKAIK